MNAKIKLLVLLLAGLVACGGSSPDSPTEAGDGAGDGSSAPADGSEGGDGGPESGDGQGGDGAGDGDGEGPSGPPVYAIITQVFSPMGQTSYALLTGSLSKVKTLDLDSAVELPGRAIGAGAMGGEALFVGGSEAGTVTRFELSEDGKALEQAGTVSFANLGINSIGEYQEQFQFLSADKAYYLDGRTAQLIVWNPREMIIERAIPLDELVVEEQLLTFSTNVQRHDGQLLVPVAWRSDTTAYIPGAAAVLRVDTDSDELGIVRDARCGYVRTAVEGADGRLYLATEAYGSAVHRIVPQNAPAPCLLRLNEAWSDFDASFHVTLSSLVEGATAGTLLPGPTPERAWLRVLDESVTPVGPATHPRVLASTPTWSWWSITLGNAPAAEADPLGLSNGSDFLLNTEDRAMIPEFSADRSVTVLRDMSTGVPGDSTLTIPGLTFSVVRLR